MTPDPRTQPTLSVEEAGALFALGRSKSYVEARRFIETGEGLPCIAFGSHTLRCPTAKVLAMLGLGSHDSSDVADIVRLDGVA